MTQQAYGGWKQSNEYEGNIAAGPSDDKARMILPYESWHDSCGIIVMSHGDDSKATTVCGAQSWYFNHNVTQMSAQWFTAGPIQPTYCTVLYLELSTRFPLELGRRSSSWQNHYSIILVLRGRLFRLGPAIDHCRDFCVLWPATEWRWSSINLLCWRFEFAFTSPTMPRIALPENASAEHCGIHFINIHVCSVAYNPRQALYFLGSCKYLSKKKMLWKHLNGTFTGSFSLARIITKIICVLIFVEFTYFLLIMPNGQSPPETHRADVTDDDHWLQAIGTTYWFYDNAAYSNVLNLLLYCTYYVQHSIDNMQWDTLNISEAWSPTLAR